MKHKALLFDLDGVLTDTAKYHFLAWKQMAGELGINFTLKDNERLKGVSRTRSLEIILEIGGVEMSDEEKELWCAKKNEIYRGYITKMTREETLPGARQFLISCRESGYLIALGSASKNSPTILERLDITQYFDAIIDGNSVSRAKPDPEVFICGAKALSSAPEECIVFEDAAAGIEAAHAAGMAAVGIGDPAALPEADICLPGFEGIAPLDVERLLERAGCS